MGKQCCCLHSRTHCPALLPVTALAAFLVLVSWVFTFLLTRLYFFLLVKPGACGTCSELIQRLVPIRNTFFYSFCGVIFNSAQFAAKPHRGAPKNSVERCGMKPSGEEQEAPQASFATERVAHGRTAALKTTWQRQEMAL